MNVRAPEIPVSVLPDGGEQHRDADEREEHRDDAPEADIITTRPPIERIGSEQVPEERVSWFTIDGFELKHRVSPCGPSGRSSSRRSYGRIRHAQTTEGMDSGAT